jgi:hypothetical protein
MLQVPTGHLSEPLKLSAQQIYSDRVLGGSSPCHAYFVGLIGMFRASFLLLDGQIGHLEVMPR